MRLPLSGLTKKKRIAMLAVGSAVVAAGVVFGYAEYSASQYAERSEAAYQDAKREVYRQLSGSDLSAQNLTSIKETTEQVATSLCAAPAIAEWRVSQSQQAECSEREQRLSNLSQRADNLIKYLESSELIAEIFDDASETLGKTKAGDYKARQKVWRQVESQLADVSVVQAYQGLLIQHQSDTKQIISRYDQLIAADSTKKRNQFDDAATELQDSYDRLGKSRSKVEEAYNEQVDALLDSVERLSA